jgi:hypothetical protein
MHRKIAYKNVHKKVMKLLNLDLIEAVKKNEKHGAIYYRLTSLGILYIITRSQFLITFRDLVKNYSKNELFKIFLYPYFEKQTILSVNSISVEKVLGDYLGDSLDSIASFLIGVDGSRQTLIPVFRWSMIPSRDGAMEADLIKFFKIRFELDWLPNNARFEKSSDKKELKVTYGKTSLTIDLQENNGSQIGSALLKVNKETIFEFTVMDNGSDPEICEHVFASDDELVNEYGQSFFAAVQRHAQNLSFTLISLEENYDYNVAVSFYPAEKWRKKQQKENFMQDINLIKKDKKFLLLCKHFYEKFEKYKPYFEKAGRIKSSVVK